MTLYSFLNNMRAHKGILLKKIERGVFCFKIFEKKKKKKDIL